MLAVVYNDYCRTGHGMLEPAYGANLFIFWWLFSLVQVCGQKAVTYFRRKKLRSWTNSFRHFLPMLSQKNPDESTDGVNGSKSTPHRPPKVIIEHTDSMDDEMCNCVVCAANSDEEEIVSLPPSYSSSCSSCSSSSTVSSPSFSEAEDDDDEEKMCLLENEKKENIDEDMERKICEIVNGTEVMIKEEMEVMENGIENNKDEDMRMIENVRDEENNKENLTLMEALRMSCEEKGEEMILGVNTKGEEKEGTIMNGIGTIDEVEEESITKEMKIENVKEDLEMMTEEGIIQTTRMVEEIEETKYELNGERSTELLIEGGKEECEERNELEEEKMEKEIFTKREDIEVFLNDEAFPKDKETSHNYEETFDIDEETIKNYGEVIQNDIETITNYGETYQNEETFQNNEEVFYCDEKTLHDNEEHFHDNEKAYHDDEKTFHKDEEIFIENEKAYHDDRETYHDEKTFHNKEGLFCNNEETFCNDQETSNNDKTTFQNEETLRRVREMIKENQESTVVRGITTEVGNEERTDKIENHVKYEEKEERITGIKEKEMKYEEECTMVSNQEEEKVSIHHLVPEVPKKSAYSQFSKLPVPLPNSPKRSSRVKKLATWFEEKVIVHSDPISVKAPPKVPLKPPVICPKVYDSNNNKRVVGELVNFFCHKDLPRPRPQPIGEARVNVMNLIETFERRAENHNSRHYPFIPLHADNFD